MIAGLVIVAGGLLVLQHFYLERRYSHTPNFTKTFARARHVHDKRIGIVETTLQYPLTGNDISNREYVVEDRKSDLVAKPIGDCETWRDQLNHRRRDYVVITTPGYPVAQIPTAREQAWTANDPAARLILTEHEGKATAWVYALPRRVDLTACPRTPSS